MLSVLMYNALNMNDFGKFHSNIASKLYIILVHKL